MRWQLSETDRTFRSDFEAGLLRPHEFDHRGHLRLAYAYLAESPVDTAVARMRGALRAFLARHSLESSKYHETLTHAWVLAVRHFMEASRASASADGFVDANRMLLDPSIMLRHYSSSVLFSERARAEFVEPDLLPIPRYSRSEEGTGTMDRPATDRPRPAPPGDGSRTIQSPVRGIVRES